MSKIWITAGDNRVRHSHAMLDGKEIPLDRTFDNGCKRPRDPNGTPAEICNCRCSLKYGVSGTEQGQLRSARKGTVTGSYKKASSFKGTKSVEAPNISYKELMEWVKTQ